MQEREELPRTYVPDALLTRVAAYSEQYAVLPGEGVLIVAVSGGADSLCLLHVLMTLRDLPDSTVSMGESIPEPMNGMNARARRVYRFRLHVAHLNHQLRGAEGAREAELIERLAQSWGLPVTVGSVDVPSLARRERRSLEDAARTARYRFLREVARAQHGQAIAVAHHQDDQVETLLLHWLRGGGIQSMLGLQARQQELIRPLLCVTHAETLAYCQRHNLTPIEDASNSDTRFLRNRIRHELLPLLEQMNPGFRGTLLRSSEVLSVDAAWLDEQVERHWPDVAVVESDGVQLSVPALNALPLSLQRHTLRHASSLLSDGQSPLELRHYHLIEELLQRPATIREVELHLPDALLVRREGNTLSFVRRSYRQMDDEQVHEDLPEEIFLAIPGTIVVPGTSCIASAEYVTDETMLAVREALYAEQWDAVFRLLPVDANTVYVDAGRVGSDTLRVRSRRPGDRMQPLGMSNAKKVQDIFVDKHIPYHERINHPLFLAEEQPIWLGGLTIDERVRLSRDTRRIIRLRLYREGDEKMGDGV